MAVLCKMAKANGQELPEGLEVTVKASTGKKGLKLLLLGNSMPSAHCM